MNTLNRLRHAASGDENDERGSIAQQVHVNNPSTSTATASSAISSQNETILNTVSSSSANSSSLSPNESMQQDGGIETQSHFDPAYMKEGYLQKKGQLLKGWKKRWFVCDGKNLCYYTNNKEKKPNAVIPFESCTVQDGGMSETWNSPRIYLTDGTIGTMYCLSSEEGGVVTEWLVVLRAAVARAKKNARTAGPKASSSSSTAVSKSFQMKLPRSPQHKQKPNRSTSPPPTGRRNPTNTSNTSSRPRQSPTNIKLENELRKAFETIEALMKCKSSFKLHTVQDGVRTSLFRDTKNNGRMYAKGSVVINAPPDVVMKIVSDVSKRSEWDVHFPQGQVVACYGGSTELVHVSGPCTLERPVVLENMSPMTIAMLSAVTTTCISQWTGLDPISCTLGGAVIAGSIANIDGRTYQRPRDALMIKHIRDYSDGSYFVIERSVVVDDAHPDLGLSSMDHQTYIRAETNAGGFLIQPLEMAQHGDHDGVLNPLQLQTLLTHITDLDLKGWMGTYARAKTQFLLERMTILAHIREYVVQANVPGESSSSSSSSSSWTGEEGEENENQTSLDNHEAVHDEFQPRDWRRGMIQVATGGLKLTDKEMTKKQKGVLMEVLKSFGAAILEGKSAVSLSLPVRIFEPRSMLNRIVDAWIYAPMYLTKAALTTTDSIERFKLCMVFAFAGLHQCVGQLKPFNPILGETYQTELSDGSKVYCEHTSHHPPISNFSIYGRGYLVWGHFVFSGSFKTNALTQVQTGPIHIDFDDGVRVTYTMPYLRSGGFLWGDRLVEILGEMVFKDVTNGHVCQLQFNPDEKKGMGGMFSTSKTPSDVCRGSIVSRRRSRTSSTSSSTSSGNNGPGEYSNDSSALEGQNVQNPENPNQDDTNVVSVSGSWLQELKFNDTCYWDIDADLPEATTRIPTAEVLPSDCRFREDLIHLSRDNLEDAQEWKLKLEKLQRADRALRKDGRQSNHWANNDATH